MPDRPSGDLLSRILELYQLRANVFATPSTCGAWQLDLAPSAHVEFHLVAAGRGYLHVDGSDGEPRVLEAGDVVVFPRSRHHVVSHAATVHEPGTRIFPSGSGPRAELVCGNFILDGAQANPLIVSLADVVVIAGTEAREELAGLARLLAREARDPRAARQSVLDRLSEVLFIYVLRHELKRGAIRGGLLSAFLDPALQRVLAALHDSPGHNWTIAALAEVAHLSRTAFLDRFQAAAGMPPMQFLTDWRMRLAQVRLQDGSRSVAAVASELGYSTEAAFRRAFKRVVGVGPGAVRRQGRPTPEPVRD